MPEDMTIGEILQNARLAKGYNYDQVEKATNIRSIYLAALEANEFEKLPGEVFIKGMLRTYGNYVGLNGNELVNQYKTLKTGKPSKDVESKGIRQVDRVRMNVRLKEKRDIGAGRDRKGLGIKVSKPEVKIPWREITAGVAVLVVLAIGYAVIPKAVDYMNRPKPAPQAEVKKEEAHKVEVKEVPKKAEEVAPKEVYVPAQKVQQAPVQQAPVVKAPVVPAQQIAQPASTAPVAPVVAPVQEKAVQPQVNVPEPKQEAPKAAVKAPEPKQEAPKAPIKAPTPKVENKPIKSK